RVWLRSRGLPLAESTEVEVGLLLLLTILRDPISLERRPLDRAQADSRRMVGRARAPAVEGSMGRPQRGSPWREATSFRHRRTEERNCAPASSGLGAPGDRAPGPRGRARRSADSGRTRRHVEGVFTRLFAALAG